MYIENKWYFFNNNSWNTSIAPICLKGQAQTQQTQSFDVIIHGDRQKSSLEHRRNNQIYMVEKQFQIPSRCIMRFILRMVAII